MIDFKHCVVCGKEFGPGASPMRITCDNPICKRVRSRFKTDWFRYYRLLKTWNPETEDSNDPRWQQVYWNDYKFIGNYSIQYKNTTKQCKCSTDPCEHIYYQIIEPPDLNRMRELFDELTFLSKLDKQLSKVERQNKLNIYHGINICRPCEYEITKIKTI